MCNITKISTFEANGKIIVDFESVVVYNTTIKLNMEEFIMKKVLAVIMAVLVVFTTCSIAVFAGETDVETTAPAVQEEATTDGFLTSGGLVFPETMNQFKTSIIFKLFEKIISFILSLFGEDTSTKIDQEGATIVDELASALDERLTDLFA